MITFMDSKEKLKEEEKCLDAQLWHACAGGMVQMPSVNTKVFYFPQGHAEHACGTVNLKTWPNVPPQILCRVMAIKYMADPETDEVYAKIKLLPLNANEVDYDSDRIGEMNGSETQNKAASFAKTLTQSDANNGGGFSVPRYCAETIFPRLDYSADPPVQNILAKDVHGETWKFRHIYRGTPRRHLLTTGWSTFVNHKRLVAGDSVVFLRAKNGDLCVGIRRDKRGIGGTPNSSSSSCWNSTSGNYPLPYRGFSTFLSEDDNKLLRNNGLSSSGNVMGRGKVRAEAVVEAANLAAKGEPFEVEYYPRTSTPEFCVKASLVKAALQIRWCSGMRFKMAFETEDSSRISWFMGTITSVQVTDPLRWPDSPWRLLQVSWDEPDLVQNVKRVSPWLVELVSNMPAIHPSPLKKMRLPQHPDFPFKCVPESSLASSIQGARHAHYDLSLSDLHLNNLQSSLCLTRFRPPNHPASPLRIFNEPTVKELGTSKKISSVLSMERSAQSSKKRNDVKTTHQLMLFGQTILSEPQMSLSCSKDTTSPILNENSSSDGNADNLTNFSDGSRSTDLHQFSDLHCREIKGNLETGHTEVFMESEDVGRTMDLSLLGSYDELCAKLEDMFSIEKSEIVSRVIYHDLTGAVKRIGDEPFSDFAKTTRRLTILRDSSSDNVGV